MVLTNNSRRTAAQVDEANPRPNNRHGHVIELDEAGQDAAATSFTWRIFLLCGDPNDQVGLNCQACPGTGQVVVQTEG